jgi:hypothetical protein
VQRRCSVIVVIVAAAALWLREFGLAAKTAEAEGPISPTSEKSSFFGMTAFGFGRTIGEAARGFSGSLEVTRLLQE